MDQSIRLRTAEDDLADQRAALTELVTASRPVTRPIHDRQADPAPKAGRRRVNLIHMPSPQVTFPPDGA